MLDPVRARAEADAAERRGAGTLWAAGPVEWDAVTAGAVAQAEVVPVVEDASGALPSARPRVAALPRAEGHARGAHGGARGDSGAPGDGARCERWRAGLARCAIGNPLTYDAAAGNRKDVCVRVDPALYRQLQAMKERLGLRTTAGAWEYVLRAGLAVGEKQYMLLGNRPLEESC